MSIGWAQPQLRSPVFSVEDEALHFQNSATEMGHESRVQRSYEHGLGWVYTVWVDGFSTLEEARSAAERLAEKTAKGVSLVEGERLDFGAAPPVLEGVPDVHEIRLRMVRAMGGLRGAANTLKDAPSLMTVMERHLPLEGLRSRQVHKRMEGRQRLEVRRSEDEWLALTGPSGAWWLRDGEMRPVDVERMEDLLRLASPEAVYAYLLDLPRLLLEDEDYLGLEVVEHRTLAHRVAIVLGHRTRHGSLELVVEAGTWLPRRVSFTGAAGVTERIFLGWHAVGSQLSLPTVMEVWGGGELWERIRLEEIELSQAFSETDFSPPEMP